MKNSEQTHRQRNDEGFEQINPSKPNGEKGSKRTSRLIVKNRPMQSIDEENIDVMENTAQSIVLPKQKVKTSNSEDYVQLPTIKFKPTAHPDEVAIEVTKAQNSIEPSQRSKHGITNQSDFTYFQNQNSSESEHEPQWACWNLSKLKIQPESTSSIEHEEMGLPVIKETKRKKQQNARVIQKEKVKDRERRERERNMQMVSNFLSGKATFIWLFILGKNVRESEMQEVKKVYSDYIQNDYEVPICRTYEDALRFLSLNNCFFKIVADLQSSEKLLEESQTNNNIIAIYLYNPRREKGITRTFELKRNSRKIKGMFMHLQDAVKQAQQQIENQVKFIRIGDDMERQSNKLRFPSFFILSGVDSSDITAYRLCLYGSLKLTQQKQREIYLKEFTDMVEMRYANSPKQLRNLQDYKLIDHTSENREDKFRDILKFYVKETFYYGLTNSILRLSRSAEEFRPCTIPFNQTFHAIKHFYTKYKSQVQCQPFVTYRGAKLRNSDVKSLKIGSFIELLGFTSTSLKRSEAQKFMDNDSYLIEIQVDSRANHPNEEIYDHGFLEINRYGLASDAFHNEEEVLFNALNVFKVVALDLDSAVRKITLKYGAILQLISKKSTPHNSLQKAVLSNYTYCTSTFEEIEDDGDVLLMAQQHDKCLQYYRNKLEEGEKNGKVYGKLAQCLVQTGDLDGAYENAIKSLEMFKQQFQNQSMQMAGKHSKSILKNAQIFDIKEDIVNYEDSIDVCLKINEQNWFLKSKLLKERADKKIQIGDLEGAKADIQSSKQIIKNKSISFEKQRRSIKRQFFFKSLCCICNRSSGNELEEEEQLELMRIQVQQIQFLSKKDETTKISLDLQNISKRLYDETGNTQKLRQCKKSAQQLFKQLKKDDISLTPLLEAQYHVLEASVVDQQHKFHQYEDLMELAIELVQQEDPFHENIGIYNKMLARKRHQIIHKKFILPNQQEEEKDQSEEKKNSRFDLEEHKRLYQQSKLGYLAANDNMVYHKGGSHPEVIQVQNQMAELDYDYSLLKQAETTMTNVASRHISSCHSQGAKCYLLLAKIALARGQVKRAFKHIQQANDILKKTLVKADTIEYNNVLLNNPLYTEIHLHRVKIFNRQLKHDLALKELEVIKKIAKKKINTEHCKNLFASIYQEQAEVMICLGETLDFEKYILKAIEIREKEMGKYNIPNAICYSNLFKYLRYINDFDQALKYHYKATEIFSRFPPDHPNAWIIHLSNGLTFHRRKQYDLAINQIQYCLKIAQKRYSSNHINLLKIQFQYGKLLHSMGYVDKAQKILEELSRILETNIKQSATHEKMERETDDQKLSIKKNLYIELKEIYSKNRSQKDLMKTMLGIQRCQSHLRQCEQFIQSDEKIDSLKSLN